MEINSNTIEEHRLRRHVNTKYWIRYFYSKITNSMLYDIMSGFVSVTYELLRIPEVYRSKVPKLVVPNCIDIDKYCPVKLAARCEKPNIVFLGTGNAPWHGVDKLLKLAAILQDKVYIHVVGMEKPVNTPLPGNIHFYGFLHSSEYRSILEKSHIGIGTLALHRNKMNEACPLKTREYIAYGLPAVVAYKDTAFLNDKVPEWVLEIPNREDNIEYFSNDIYGFSVQMMGRRIPREEIADYVSHRKYEGARMEFMKDIAARHGQ
jgi:glycosyltransferase involved in cell wall biosynthesis